MMSLAACASASLRFVAAKAIARSWPNSAEHDCSRFNVTAFSC
jgi:hypothetical protein